ncbi:MAG: VanZ family protein [Acetatifactor sp.]|nr:VanZ family protein [Acetatifactor sp.]
MKKKLIISIPAALLLILLYCTMFSFSSEEAEVSGSRSHDICMKAVELVDALNGQTDWSEIQKNAYADRYETFVRKLAHFTEYCISGVLLYILLSQWVTFSAKIYILMILWILLTASFDEIHQLFVSGRDGNIPDVLLDTLGGSTGIFLSYRISHYFHKKRTKKETL